MTEEQPATSPDLVKEFLAKRKPAGEVLQELRDRRADYIRRMAQAERRRK